jgi:alginate O-acetyltransferase complex protein AlgI
MLFNSFEFIFLFLPVCLAGYALLGRWCHHRAAIAWLVVCSAYYYARWTAPELDDWTPRFLLIMLASVGVNFVLGRALIDVQSNPHAGFGASSDNRDRPRVLDYARPSTKGFRIALLAAGVLFNFGLLVYFKYTGFFIRSTNSLFSAAIPIPSIILPLAFSFHTFQQHAYLVDAYKGRAGRYSLLDYSLFVLFFPQLLAGPIVHHHEMLPQFASHRVGHLRARHLAVGGSMFVIGLFKKVMLADRVAPFVAPVFNAAFAGRPLSFGDAWLGALAFTFQLYFDFSAYSDMAIGVARMLGIRLPMNFNSPYKSASMIDFWRRWHMTLSRWLRDYIYIPLGGSRKGEARRWINLMITMLLGGLWHGAGWTFVFWGGLHGAYLGINHFWRRITKIRDTTPQNSALTTQHFVTHAASILLTFLAVTFAWVFFQARDFRSAWRIIGSMCGSHGFALKSQFGDRDEAMLLGLLLAIAWFLPNTQQIMHRFRPALGYFRTRVNPAGVLQWRPNLWWAATLAFGGVLALTHLSVVREFIYYQF